MTKTTTTRWLLRWRGRCVIIINAGRGLSVQVTADWVNKWRPSAEEDLDGRPGGELLCGKNVYLLIWYDLVFLGGNKLKIYKVKTRIGLATRILAGKNREPGTI